MFRKTAAGVVMALAVALATSGPAPTSARLDTPSPSSTTQAAIDSTVMMTGSALNCGPEFAIFHPPTTTCDHGIYIFENIYSTATINQSVAELVYCNVIFTCVGGTVASMTATSTAAATPTSTIIHVPITSTAIEPTTEPTGLTSSISTFSNPGVSDIDKANSRTTVSGFPAPEWSWLYQTLSITATGWVSSDTTKTPNQMSTTKATATTPSAPGSAPSIMISTVVISARDDSCQATSATSPTIRPSPLLSALIFPHRGVRRRQSRQEIK